MQGAPESTLRDYLHVVWRRKLTIVAAIAITAGAALAFSLRQQHLYRASAQVLLSNQNLTLQVAGVSPTPGTSNQPGRIAQTQADLARVPLVADRTLRAAGLRDRTPADLIAHSSVKTKSDSDLLTFAVTDPSPALARRLATAYARQYTVYRRQLDTGAIARALTEVNRKIAALEASGDRKSALYTGLVEKQQTLQTMKALQTSNAYVVRVAERARQVQPRTVRNGILGLLLGLVLGLGLAFLRQALDTRVRTSDDVARLLGLPLLGRIPAPPRALGRQDKLVMIAEPRGEHAEPFRMLRTNLEFVNLERKARTIVVTSALEGEGKSTTAANLAVALARAGQHTVLVDLDLRRPYLHRFFALQGHPGLTDVALRHARLEAALAPIVLSGAQPPAGGAQLVSGNGGGKAAGVLEVLTSGPIPPNPGEFVGSAAVAEVLSGLAGRAEAVIVDSAPLLGVGDTLKLGAFADALLLVTRLNTVRKPLLSELHRVLAGSPTPALGFVVTEAQAEERYGYGYHYYRRHYGRRLSGEEATGRAERLRA